MRVSDRPVFTSLYESPGLFDLDPGSAYLFGTSVEDRSLLEPGWQAVQHQCHFVPILAQDDVSIEVELMEVVVRVMLRGDRSLQWLIERLPEPVLYIDITGLSHHVWAPILRAALRSNKIVRVVYAEPLSYKLSESPTDGEIFDLSERIEEVRPLPGFARLAPSRGERFLFVPLLGFEGARLSFMIEQIEPASELVFPVIGVPGFRLDFPFYTYYGNRRPLMQGSRAWRNRRFAAANCPFSLLYVLEELAREYPNRPIKIAPIGTKPHALGAVLHRLCDPERIDIVYDHPKRKRGRTEGKTRILVYHVSFLRSRMVLG